jgi:uncharacterized membrane protein
VSARDSEAGVVRPRAQSKESFGGGALALILVTAITLTAGFALKANCTHKPWDGRQWSTSCANDIYLLYYVRGLDKDRSFPPALEYPAGTDIYVGVANTLSHSDVGFVAVNAVGLALAGFAITAALIAMVAERKPILYFALGPSLVLYAFNNWDLLAVALATAGLLQFRRHRYGWAGLALGLGTAVKLYPALLLPGILLAAWRTTGDEVERRHRLRKVSSTFAIGVGLPNALVYLLSARAWGFFWSFQSARFPNPETSWFMVFRHVFPHPSSGLTDAYPTFANVASAALLVLAAALLIRAEARREVPSATALSFGLVIAFLITTKVFSPQYVLWLLPLFVLLELPWYSYAALVLSDLSVWFSVNWYYLTASRGGDWNWWLNLLEAAVWARYFVLAWLLWLSRRVPERAPAEALTATRGPAAARVGLLTV